MSGWKVKLLGLAVFALGGSLLLMLGPHPPESDESIQSVPPEADGSAVPENLALRIAAKNHIVDEVIAGRLSLVRAAALFDALNRLSPHIMKVPLSDPCALRPRFPANTDEEQLCWQVLSGCVSKLAEDQDRLEATLVRLEAEFKEELRRGQTVRWPEALPPVVLEELLEQAREALQRIRISDRGDERKARPRNADVHGQDSHSQKSD
jgi:hypothetical protein